jgi:hypothetical protein
MATIPLDFSESGDDYLAGLVVTRSTGVVQVSWPLIGVTLRHYETDERSCHAHIRLPPPELIRGENVEFVVFGDFGFRAGSYAEFTVFEPWFHDPPERRAWTKLGTVEASIGEPTPLMRYVMGYPLGTNDAADGWNGIHTIRLNGVSPSSVERRLLQALLTFRTRLGANDLTITGVSEPEDSYDPDDETLVDGTEVLGPEFCVAEIEPLRLFHQGVAAKDPEYAFLQFYRILEYYSVLRNLDDVAKLRWDRSVSASEFVRHVLTGVPRDERALLCRFVAHVASQDALQRVAELGLASSSEAGVVANALYEFRNAIVHGKYDMRAAMHTVSILETSPIVAHWNEVARLLATAALRQCGVPDY